MVNILNPITFEDMSTAEVYYAIGVTKNIIYRKKRDYLMYKNINDELWKIHWKSPETFLFIVKEDDGCDS